MGKARVIFEDGFSQPLFRDISFDQIDWDTTSFPTNSKYKISSEDMLFKQKVTDTIHKRKSIRSRTSEFSKSWSAKSYTGEIEVEGYGENNSYKFVLKFENGHLVELKKV
jgi:hypothetical protein